MHRLAFFCDSQSGALIACPYHCPGASTDRIPDRIRSPRSPRRQAAQPGQPQDELFKRGSLLAARAKDTGGIGELARLPFKCCHRQLQVVVSSCATM